MIYGNPEDDMTAVDITKELEGITFVFEEEMF